MAKIWRILLIAAGALFVLGLALAAVSLISGGSLSRILSTTDVADYTKFVSQEQLEALFPWLF